MPTITDILAAIDALKRGISTDPLGTLKDYGKGALAGIGDTADMVNSVGGLIRGNPVTPPEFGPAVRGLIGSTGTSVENTGGLLGLPGPGTLGMAAKAGALAKDALPLGGLLGQLVFHGTPHKFDKFDLSKIGTGEGAQAYGHGIYFAEEPAVAKQYQDALKWRGTDWNDPQIIATQAVEKHGDRQSASEALKWALDQNSKSPNPMQIKSNEITKRAISILDEGAPLSGKPPSPGALYKQDLPDSVLPKMLQWDRPLSEQPEAFAKLKASGIINDKSPPYQKSGKATPAALMQMPGEVQSITRALTDAGIPGLSYLDQGSRAGGKGTMNHVIWDQDLLDRMTPTRVP